MRKIREKKKEEEKKKLNPCRIVIVIVLRFHPVSVCL